MMEQAIIVYFSHLISRYWFPAKVLNQKNRVIRLLVTIFPPMILTYVLIGTWENLTLPLLVTIPGLFQYIFLSTITSKNLGKQLLFEFFWLLFALILSFSTIQHPVAWTMYLGNSFLGLIVLIGGWTISAFPAGILIAYILRGFPNRETVSFENSGKVIGILERSIIFVLFIINTPIGVGFLITAKMIRFGDVSKSRNNDHLEYVLIGTLLSFLLGMVVALLTIWGADLFFAETSFKLLR